MHRFGRSGDSLGAPRIVLDVNKDGTPNWVFKAQETDKPFPIPEVGAFAIDHGSATYRDPRIDTDLR